MFNFSWTNYTYFTKLIFIYCFILVVFLSLYLFFNDDIIIFFRVRGISYSSNFERYSRLLCNPFLSLSRSLYTAFSPVYYRRLLIRPMRHTRTYTVG